ncbi:hypothetical protein JTB14_004970 [Gonioctena quinquepunctata]|nr:hypothetical protein JTB14_004970 [Gonioctena quinquepunctata]
MFKIVESIEEGNKELTVVPKRWEKCGTLFWPKKFAYKYQQVPEPTPDPDWISILFFVVQLVQGSHSSVNTIDGGSFGRLGICGPHQYFQRMLLLVTSNKGLKN